MYAEPLKVYLEQKCSQLKRQRGKTKKIEEEKEIVQHFIFVSLKNEGQY